MTDATTTDEMAVMFESYDSLEKVVRVEPGLITFYIDGAIIEPMTKDIRDNGWVIDYVNPKRDRRLYIRISRDLEFEE